MSEDYIKKRSVLGSQKIVVGDSSLPLILANAGGVYFQYGSSYKKLSDLISNNQSAINIVDETPSSPKSGVFYYNTVDKNLAASIEGTLIDLATTESQGNYILKSGDSVSGVINFAQNFTVVDTTMINNLNAEYLGGFKAEEFIQELPQNYDSLSITDLTVHTINGHVFSLSEDEDETLPITIQDETLGTSVTVNTGLLRESLRIKNQEELIAATNRANSQVSEEESDSIQDNTLYIGDSIQVSDDILTGTSSIFNYNSPFTQIGSYATLDWLQSDGYEILGEDSNGIVQVIKINETERSVTGDLGTETYTEYSLGNVTSLISVYNAKGKEAEFAPEHTEGNLTWEQQQFYNTYYDEYGKSKDSKTAQSFPFICTKGIFGGYHFGKIYENKNVIGSSYQWSEVLTDLNNVPDTNAARNTNCNDALDAIKSLIDNNQWIDTQQLLKVLITLVANLTQTVTSNHS